jgi:putative ABC transport system substrate-binding protein
MIKRRDFIAGIGSAAACSVFLPRVANAQAPARPPHVGILDFFPSSDFAATLAPFHEGLRELGYRDGHNIRVEYHSAEQRSDRAAALAADYVKRKVDVIVALATPAAHAAKSATESATTSIPVVMMVANALATGLVSNLARPGGNLTGVSTTATDLAGKRIELLREIRPGAARIAFLGAANDPNTRTFVQETAAAAGSLGVQFQPVLVTGPEEFEAAFAKFVSEGADGLIVQPLFSGHRVRLVELAMRARLPLIADQPPFAAAGGLAAYGADRAGSVKRLAYYVDRIINGAQPAELPIEQPTRFHLVINLKTAKALGLSVPPKLLFTADEVIE